MAKVNRAPNVAELIEQVRVLKAENARLAELVASFNSEEGDYKPSAPPAEGDDASQTSVVEGEGAKPAPSGSGQQGDSGQAPPVRGSRVMVGRWYETKGWRIWRRDDQSPPKRQVGVDEWQVVSGRHVARPSQARVAQGSQVVTRNRFEALQEDEAEEKVEVVVIGDSRVRHLNGAFGRKKGRRCITRPGAKVTDLVAPAAQVTVELDPETLILQVGVNDIASSRSEELVDRYRYLLSTIRREGKRTFVTGILPKLGASTEWSSRALAANDRISKLCVEQGMLFIDAWDKFYGRRDLYGRDGLHFSVKGVEILSGVYERAIQGN